MLDTQTDIFIENEAIKKDKLLYDSIQSQIKKILSKGHLPIFNIENYKIERQIGEGSFGLIYQVKNKTTNEVFACKKVSKINLIDLEKFKNEISIMSKADHPHIVKLFEIYESNRSLYLIMELCKGGELFTKITERAQKKNMYSEKDAAEIFQSIMSGIEYCHNHGVCHRDLKPENILYLNEDDEKNNPLKI